jgi:hypothetical protein
VLITGKYLGEWTCLAIKSPAMTLHCGVRKDITLLGFPISESLDHTFLA